jgi:site-specific DNA-methyltransferase (adenine-specific)/modification methylase
MAAVYQNLTPEAKQFKHVVIGDCVLFHADSFEVLPLLDPVDAVVTDPPYGIGESSRKAATRGKLAPARDYGGQEDWDQEPASPHVIEWMRANSDWQIIFGGNYFTLPPASCWLVWDKMNGDNDFADCELAWTNLPKAVRRIRHMWNGMLRKGNEDRHHLTQKPLGVMEWALGQLPDSVSTVLDPYMGSGTTGVACVKKQLSFIGIEREEHHFNIACERIRRAYGQLDLFIDYRAPRAPEAVQQAFLLEAAE